MKQWLRYGLVGICNSFVGLGIITGLMHGFHFSHGSATFIGNSTGILISYTLNRRYTFQDDGRVSATFIRFIIVSLGCYLLAYVILHQPIVSILSNWPMTREFRWLDDVIVGIEALFYTACSFVLHRQFSFAKPKEDAAVEGHAEG